MCRAVSDLLTVRLVFKGFLAIYCDLGLTMTQGVAMNELGNLLTVREVAQKIGWSRASIYLARKRGDFAPEIRLGNGAKGRVLFPEKQLAEWLAQRMTQPATLAA